MISLIAIKASESLISYLPKSIRSIPNGSTLTFCVLSAILGYLYKSGPPPGSPDGSTPNRDFVFGLMRYVFHFPDFFLTVCYVTSSHARLDRFYNTSRQSFYLAGLVGVISREKCIDFRRFLTSCFLWLYHVPQCTVKNPPLLSHRVMAAKHHYYSQSLYFIASSEIRQTKSSN